MALPQPTVSVGMKLAMAVVHLEEALEPGGHELDLAAAQTLLADDGVRDYMRELDALALLPVKRSSSGG